MKHVRVKICGITRVEDALAAQEAGADAIGLVFYDKSPRYMEDLDLARQIAKAVGPFVSVTGLFVNPELATVHNIVKLVPLNLLQFHGDEDEAWCNQFSLPYIKALRVSEAMDLPAQIAQFPSAGGILLDTYKKGVPGGTGETFDWHLVPAESALPVVLAGGLDSGNVAAAIQTCSPYGVDVSGGVESAPGIKSAQKIHKFVGNTKPVVGGREKNTGSTT